MELADLVVVKDDGEDDDEDEDPAGVEVVVIEDVPPMEKSPVVAKTWFISLHN